MRRILLTLICGLATFAQVNAQVPTIPQSQPPRQEPFNPGTTTVGSAARGAEILLRTFNMYRWGAWEERISQATESAAKRELQGKPVGTSVVIHAGSLTPVKLDDAPFVAPPTESDLDVQTIGRGDSDEQALEDAFLRPSIRNDTQTQRITLATNTESGISVKPVSKSDVQKLAEDNLRKVQAQAKQKEDQAKSDAERAEAAKSRAEAERRYQEYHDAMQASEKCRVDCEKIYEHAADQLEIAQKAASTALCAPEGAGGTAVGGPCGGPHGCPVCSSAITDRLRYNDNMKASALLGSLASTISAANKQVKNLGTTLKTPLIDAPKLRSGQYMIK